MCEQFTYLGSGGNRNNFAGLAECRARCKGKNTSLVTNENKLILTGRFIFKRIRIHVYMVKQWGIAMVVWCNVASVPWWPTPVPTTTTATSERECPQLSAVQLDVSCSQDRSKDLGLLYWSNLHFQLEIDVLSRWRREFLARTHPNRVGISIRFLSNASSSTTEGYREIRTISSPDLTAIMHASVSQHTNSSMTSRLTAINYFSLSQPLRHWHSIQEWVICESV